MTSPSDHKPLLVDVFHMAGHEPFVCGVNGRATVADLCEIERDLGGEGSDLLAQGDGVYLFEAYWQEAQADEYGRVELPAYWDLSLVTVKPFDP